MLVIELYNNEVFMVNFVLRKGSQSIKRSLRTHCPIMIRHHVKGQHFDEDVCRCDVVSVKKEIEQGRCRSNNECPARKHLISIEQEVEGNYELLD